MMAELSPQHKDYLLIHLVRSDKVIQRALPVLEAKDFDPQFERHLAIIWAVSSTWFKQHQRVIPRMMLEADVHARMAGDTQWANDPFIQQRVSELIDLCYLCPEDQLVHGAAINILQLYLDERKVRPAAQIATQGSLPEMITEINRVYAATRLSTNDSVNVFDLTRSEIDEEQLPVVPTGFLPFDYLLNGGPRKRWTIGLLGPIGGGKTMMAVLAALHNVKTNNEYVDLFTYEQPIEPDVRERLWIAATGVDRKLIEGKRFSELEPTVQDKIREARTLLSRLRIFDFSGGDKNNPLAGGGGMEEVEAAVQHEIRQGRKPGAIIIDWVGDAAQRQMNTRNDTDPKKKTAYITMFMSQAKQLSGRYDLWSLMCHQLNAAAGSMGPTGELTHYDAADCRMFSALCTACITINRKSLAEESGGKKHWVAKITNPKARCGGPGLMWVEIDDVRHQMTPTNSEYALVWGRGGEVKLRPKSDATDTLAGAAVSDGANALNSIYQPPAAVRPPALPPGPVATVPVTTL